MYDSIQEKRQAANDAYAEKAADTRPKYMATILKAAEDRKKENDRLYERKQIKDRLVDDHLHEDKEKFITSAYKEKLREDKLWEVEEKIRDEQERLNDVTKKGGMTDFYRNLLDSGMASRSSAVTLGTKEEQEAKGLVYVPTPSYSCAHTLKE